MIQNDVQTFLAQSNYIEDEYSKGALEDAIKAWIYIIKHDQLTIENILKTHKILMQRRDIDKKYKGAFRDVQVWIGGREGLNHLMIREAIKTWLFNANLYKEHWQNNHVRYEKIHPFIDGNGRTGRIFLNWMRVKIGMPVLIIYENEKHKYYSWFKQ